MQNPVKSEISTAEAAVRKWAFISECAAGAGERLSGMPVDDEGEDGGGELVESQDTDGRTRTTEPKYCATLIGFLGERARERTNSGPPC